MAGFKSERAAGFNLECMAGFIGIRTLDNVQGEWSLVTMAWNMKRMYALAAA